MLITEDRLSVSMETLNFIALIVIYKLSGDRDAVVASRRYYSTRIRYIPARQQRQQGCTIISAPFS